jgi:chromosome segregation ATPase
VAQADLLRDVLELARKEKALEGDALVTFATALRDRARLVLAERIAPLEERIQSLEVHRRSVDTENAWRREAMEGLEKRVRGLEGENAWARERVRALEAENAWRREAITTLEERAGGFEAESAWRRDAMAGLEARVRGLEAELQTLAGDHARATRAHAELMAHHGRVVRQVIAEALAVAALPWIHVRQARRRLASLAELLRPEAP